MHTTTSRVKPGRGVFLFVSLGGVLERKPRASSMIGKYCASEPHPPQPCGTFFYLRAHLSNLLTITLASRLYVSMLCPRNPPTHPPLLFNRPQATPALCPCLSPGVLCRTLLIPQCSESAWLTLNFSEPWAPLLGNTLILRGSITPKSDMSSPHLPFPIPLFPKLPPHQCQAQSQKLSVNVPTEKNPGGFSIEK
jgi:hypothetical protein